jgi:activator of HSP90 ATPase
LTYAPQHTRPVFSFRHAQKSSASSASITLVSLTVSELAGWRRRLSYLRQLHQLAVGSSCTAHAQNENFTAHAQNNSTMHAQNISAAHAQKSNSTLHAQNNSAAHAQKNNSTAHAQNNSTAHVQSESAQMPHNNLSSNWLTSVRILSVLYNALVGALFPDLMPALLDLFLRSSRPYFRQGERMLFKPQPSLQICSI